MKLTVTIAAKCLEIPVSTVERWIRQGRIPVQRTREGLYFKEPDLQKWAKKHHMSYTPPLDPCKEIECVEPKDLLTAISNGSVHHGVAGRSREDVLKSAVDRFDFLSLDEKDDLFKKIMDREQMASTGIGQGVAVPHRRSPGSVNTGASSIVTCFLEHQVPYNAVDDQPVFVLFILLSRSVKTHLNLLSRLSFCLRSKPFIAFLKTRPSHEELMDKIGDFEESLDGTSP